VDVEQRRMSWSTLLPVALVGTERHAGALPSWSGEVGVLITQAMQGAAQPSTGVLRAAGVLAASNLAGTLGTPLGADALPTPAALDTLPELAEPRLVSLAAWTLAQGPQRLAHDVLHALALARMRLPTLLLPAALDAGRRSLALRPQVTPVLGARGLWLAARRDTWQYAAGVQVEGDDEAQWSDGSLDQRTQFLRRERLRAPSAARARLEAVLSELPAQERADLVGVLAAGLSMDDEPLLDRLRADRSREVRHVALSHLLRLPPAAHPQRAVQRMAAMMSHERALLRKRWTIDAPTAKADDWARDNVDADKPKHEPLGERAWWLMQIARQVPLAWWSEHTSMTPAELLQWATKTDWTDSLHRAWYDVLLAAPDAAWADAFCDAWPKALRGRDEAPVMAMLEPVAREKRWLRMIEGDNFSSELLLPQMVSACAPKPVDANATATRLSPAVSMALVTWFGKRLAEPRALANAWSLRQHMPDVACILDHAALPALATLTTTPRNADDTASVTELIQVLSQVVAVRQAFASLSPSAANEVR
jgi:hypothetical protein